MKINQRRFVDVLGAPDERYVIPVFQRVYSWSSRQCEELWDDLLRAGRTGNPHFMGLLLFVPDTDTWNGCAQFDVIDGQQRMTTLTLLLAALRDHLASAQLPEHASVPVAAEMEARYLQAGQDGKSPKLVLSQMDRETLSAIVGTGDMPEEPAERLLENKAIFGGKMDAPDFDVEALWKGLELLETAVVVMQPEDSPQLVFESLNSKGMPLSTADRVRNLLIASTSGDEQERLYEGSWLALEQAAGSAAQPSDVTGIIEAWLAGRYRSVRIFDRSDVYGVFKTCLRSEFDGSLESLLNDVGAYAERFLSDAQFREEQEAAAEEWTAGKPEKSVSEYKMFGD